MKHKFFYLVLHVLFLFSLQVRAEWQYPITNYTRHSYEAASQNWMLMQHGNGWMYVANDKGLLEFDGINWNIYSMDNAKLRTVNKGDDGRIYLGGFSACLFPVRPLHFL